MESEYSYGVINDRMTLTQNVKAAQLGPIFESKQVSLSIPFTMQRQRNIPRFPSEIGNSLEAHRQGPRLALLEY